MEEPKQAPRRRPWILAPHIDGMTYTADPIRRFLFAQLVLVAAAAFGAVLATFGWALKLDRWDYFSIPGVWLHAFGVGGFWFWVIGAIQFGQIAATLRSWFWVSTLAPGAIAFPLIWWFNAANN